jgi:hypothetical protein
MLKDDPQDEKLYAAAAAELDGDGRDEGLWAKCFAECEGDEQKAKAYYLKIRVERLRPATSEEEASTPPVIEDSEVAPVTPVGTVTEPRRSYKSWIIGCLGVLLLVGAIGISAGWWMYSQRYVLTESEAHTEMVFRIKPNEDLDKQTEIPVTDEAKQQVIEVLKNRLKNYGVKHSVVGSGEDLISVKLPFSISSELKVVRGVLTNHGKLEFRLSHPDSESPVNSVSAVRA